MTPETNRTFTSQRLDWEKCLRFDPRIYPFAKVVGCAISSRASATNGTAYVSDETLADDVGCPGQLRRVRRARVLLLQTRWLKWRRTRDANVYTLLFGRVSDFLDLMTAARDLRKERRKKRKSRFPDRTPVSYLKPPDRTPVSALDRTPVSAILPSRISLAREKLPIEQQTQMGMLGKSAAPPFSTVKTSTKH